MIDCVFVRPMVIAVLAYVVGSCTPPDAGRLDDRDEVDLQINDLTFRAWISDDSDERQLGLMFITAEEMARLPDGAERAMLFIFDYDQPASQGFWMRNVSIPLDIAYIDSDGVILTILTMAPLDETTPYQSQASYRYALEVKGNIFSNLDISVGDTVEIPQSLLNR